MEQSKTYSMAVVLLVIIAFTEQITTQTIQLPLSTGDDRKLTTFIQIGMQIDINQSWIQVCCKIQNSIFQKMYHFLYNPFFQIHDYSCKDPNEEGFVKDSVKIAKLGFIEIMFMQQQFPACSKGVLGLSNQSYFLSLLPTNLNSYTIFQNQAQFKKYTLKFGQDTSAIKQYTYFDLVKQHNWAVQPYNIKYNQVQVVSYPLVFNSVQNVIRLPQRMYEFVANQLITGFECRQISQKLYCPCETGLTGTFPSFFFIMPNFFNLQIKPNNYMLQDTQTCRVQIQLTYENFISANILFFQDFIFKFDSINKKIGVLKSLNDQSSHQVKIYYKKQKIKLPLQLILNCLVILLLCIFLALVMIEIIKKVSGLAEVRDQVFRVDFRHKNQFHYAVD